LARTAVDGVEASRNHPNIFHSLDIKDDKFTVDLQADSDVSEVVYYNRKDCCRNRIIGAKINLLDSDRLILGTYTFTTGDLKIIVDRFKKSSEDCS